MERNKQLVFLLLSLLLAAVAGCGNNAGSGAVSTLAASESCIGCHANATSPGTGADIVTEWKASAHNTETAANTTGFGSGCRNCHEPAPGHPNSCGKCHGGVTPGALSSQDVVINPDQDQICFNCHGLAHPNDVMLQNAPEHFGNMTASRSNYRYRASYVSSRYVGNCRNCHNPHDPSSNIEINRDWAKSGHNDPKGSPRGATGTGRDFKMFGTYQPVNTTFQSFCVRCHTTTGYINYVTSDFSDQRPFAGPGFPVVQNPYTSVSYVPVSTQMDKSKEVTGCNACHDDGRGNAYGFKVRTVAATRAYYNYSSAGTSPTVKLNNNPVYYPNIGTSNVCMPCHVGRGIGQMIKDAEARMLNFSSVRSLGAHDYTAGAILFKKSGYEFAGRSYDNLPIFAHDRIGVANFSGTGSSGPCVTCHMTPARHTFQPVSMDNSGAILSIVSPVCVNCHNYYQSGSSGSMLQDKKADSKAAQQALNQLIKAKGLTSLTKNWAAVCGKGYGANTMGAYFNNGLFSTEPGAFAHNSVYVKRLIYDSIDWLDDCQLNQSTADTIIFKIYTSPAARINRDNTLSYIGARP